MFWTIPSRFLHGRRGRFWALEENSRNHGGLGEFNILFIPHPFLAENDKNYRVCACLGPEESCPPTSRRYYFTPWGILNTFSSAAATLTAIIFSTNAIDNSVKNIVKVIFITYRKMDC